MKYKVEVYKLIEQEGTSYPSREEVYEQQFEELDVRDLAAYLNKPAYKQID